MYIYVIRKGNKVKKNIQVDRGQERKRSSKFKAELKIRGSKKERQI